MILFPLVVFGVWASPILPLLRVGPWYPEDPQIRVGSLVVLILILWSFLIFGTLALVWAKPSGHAGQRARRVTLNVLGFVFGLTGVVALCGVGTGKAPLLSVFLICVPLSLGTYYVVAKEANPQMNVTRFSRTVLLWVLAVVAGVAVLVTTASIAIALDFKAIVPVVGALPLVFAALVLALGPLNWFLRWRARRRGGKEVMLGVGFFGRIHRWTPVPDTEAELEWTKMGRYPQGGQLKSGWRCRDCPTIRLECCDAEGRRYMLFGGVQRLPWLRWLAGLFVRVADSGPWGGPTRWALRVFERAECRWTAMTDDSTEEQRAKLGDSAARVSSARRLVCRDCPAVRFDCIDTEGRDFLVFTNLQEVDEPKWYAGFYVAFGRAPTLASDTMGSSWSAPAATSSSPPPTTQP